MRLNEQFIVHLSDGESLLVPTADAPFSGLVQGNKSVGAILELLGTDITEVELIDRMEARFDAPREVLEQDVASTLKQLREIGAIDE